MGLHIPSGSRVGVHLPCAPISAALKKCICNLYEALEIGALQIQAKPRQPSAPFSLCFPPSLLLSDPTRAAAIAVAVKIYRAVPAGSEPGEF